MVPDWSSLIHIYGDDHKEYLKNTIAQIVDSSQTALKPDDFSHLDVLHPSGHLGIRKFINTYRIDEQSMIFDVGSGLGGTARFLEEVTGCRVDSIDYLPHFVELATEITRHTGQGGKIDYKCGDIKEYNVKESAYDAAIAITVFLVIPGTGGFFTIHRGLKVGGYFYMEDYLLAKEIEEMTDEEKKEVEGFALPGSRTEQTLVRELTEIGFELTESDDISFEWSMFCLLYTSPSPRDS